MAQPLVPATQKRASLLGEAGDSGANWLTGSRHASSSSRQEQDHTGSPNPNAHTEAIQIQVPAAPRGQVKASGRIGCGMGASELHATSFQEEGELGSCRSTRVAMMALCHVRPEGRRGAVFGAPMGAPEAHSQRTALSV